MLGSMALNPHLMFSARIGSWHIVMGDLKDGTLSTVKTTACASSALLAQSLCPLSQHIPKSWIVSVLVHMMYPYMSLKIIRTWVLVLSVRAEWAHIFGTFMDKTVSYHFVLSFETFAAFTSRTVLDRTAVRAVCEVNIAMRAEEVLSLEGCGSASWVVARTAMMV
jgi:hypothetical protein